MTERIKRMTKTELQEAVFQALGEASMCWSQTPSGVFEDVRALEIGNNLVAAIMGALDHEQEWRKYVGRQYIADYKKMMSEKNEKDNMTKQELKELYEATPEHKTYAIADRAADNLFDEYNEAERIAVDARTLAFDTPEHKAWKDAPHD